MRTTIGNKYWISSVKISKGIYETKVFPLIILGELGFNKTLVNVDYGNDLEGMASNSWFNMYKNHKKLVKKYKNKLPYLTSLNNFWH